MSNEAQMVSLSYKHKRALARCSNDSKLFRKISAFTGIAFGISTVATIFEAARGSPDNAFAPYMASLVTFLATVGTNREYNSRRTEVEKIRCAHIWGTLMGLPWKKP